MGDEQQQPPRMKQEDDNDEEIVFVGEFDKEETVNHQNLNQELINFENSLKVNQAVTQKSIQTAFVSFNSFLDKFRTELKSLTSNYDKAVRKLKEEKQQVETKVNELKEDLNALRANCEAIKEVEIQKNEKIAELEKAVDELNREKGKLVSDVKEAKEMADSKIKELEKALKKMTEERTVEEVDRTNTSNDEFSTPLPAERNKRRHDDVEMNDSGYYDTQSSSSKSPSPNFATTKTTKKKRFETHTSSKESPENSQEQALKILNHFEQEEAPEALTLIEHLAILWFNKNKNSNSSPIQVTKKVIQHLLRTEKVDNAMLLLQKQNLVTCDMKHRPVMVEFCSLKQKIWDQLSLKIMKNKSKVEKILNELLSTSNEKKLKELDTRGSAPSFNCLLKLVENLSSALGKEKDRNVILFKKKIACYLKKTSGSLDTAQEVLEFCFDALTDDEDDDDNDVDLERTMIRREIAEIHLQKGEYEDAYKIYKQVSPAYKDHYGPQSPEAINVHLELYEVSKKLDKVDEGDAIAKVYWKHLNGYATRSGITKESKFKKEEMK